MEFHGKSFMDFDVPNSQTEFHEVELLWNSIEFHKLCFRRIPWNSMSQYQTEFHGKFSIKFHGIPWNSMGLFYTGINFLTAASSTNI